MTEYIRGIVVLALIIIAEAIDWKKNGIKCHEGLVTVGISAALVVYTMVMTVMDNFSILNIFTKETTYEIIPISSSLAEELMFLTGITYFYLMFIFLLAFIILIVLTFCLKKNGLRKASAIIAFLSTLFAGIAYSDIVIIVGSITAFVFYMRKIKKMTQKVNQ